MSEDGRIDYSRYSREELLQVLDHIDGERFPLNLERAREELAKRPVISLPPPPPRPAPTKEERTAAALKLDVSPRLIGGCTVLLIVLSFACDLVAASIGLSEKIRSLCSLLPVLGLSVLLATHSPSGFYVNASAIVLGNTAFWTLLALGGSSETLDSLSVLPWLFWSLCTVSVTGLLCGLWHIGERRNEDA